MAVIGSARQQPYLLFVHGRRRHIVRMTDPAVPNPVVIALEFSRNGMVQNVRRREFGMRAVMTGLAIDPTAHFYVPGVVEDRVFIECAWILLVLLAMAASALRFINPGSPAVLKALGHSVQISMTIAAGLTCVKHHPPQAPGLRPRMAVIAVREDISR